MFGPAPPPMSQDGDRFLSAIAAAQVDEKLPKSTWVLYLMLAFVACFVAWAAWAEVDEITRADGRIVPDGKEQLIASLEPGLLGELMVKEGQTVKQGQALLRLDPTRMAAAQNEGELKSASLSATAARLRAEANGMP
jgi:adhesin transport system membrane fusion protein